jgi:hypothetical protein
MTVEFSTASLKGSQAVPESPPTTPLDHEAPLLEQPDSPSPGWKRRGVIGGLMSAATFALLLGTVGLPNKAEAAQLYVYYTQQCNMFTGQCWPVRHVVVLPDPPPPVCGARSVVGAVVAQNYGLTPAQGAQVGALADVIKGCR